MDFFIVDLSVYNKIEPNPFHLKTLIQENLVDQVIIEMVR